MNHAYQPPWPGAPPSLPCRLCTRPSGAHDLPGPVMPGARLDHNELLRRAGRCDGRCGRHARKPFGHNERLRLYGRCDDHPAHAG